MSTAPRVIIASTCAAGLLLSASAARAQLGPPPSLEAPTLEPSTPTVVQSNAPPALPAQAIEPPDSAQLLAPIIVPPALVFATPRVTTPVPSTRFQDRFARVSIATLASAGTTLITGSLTAGAVFLANTCGWSCALSTSITVGSTLSLLSLFAVPATYSLAADRFGSRGSFWATFGGFSIGALIGAGIVALDVVASARGPSAISVSIAAMLPFVAQALAYELVAQPALVDPPRTARRNAVLPTIALGDNVAIGVAGQF